MVQFLRNIAQHLLAALAITGAVLSCSQSSVFASSYLTSGNSQQPTFVENKGQWAEEALYCATLPGLNLWITKTGIVHDRYVVDFSESPAASDPYYDLSIRGHVASMTFLNTAPELIGHTAIDPVGTVHHYFNSKEAAQAITNVAHSRSLRLSNVYPNIDAVYYFDNGLPRYDLVVMPDGNPQDIRMSFSGTDEAFINSDGELEFRTSVGAVVHNGLLAYQIIDDQKKRIECSFQQYDAFEFGFKVGAYDPDIPIIIDPLIYSAYLGHNHIDEALAVTHDRSDAAYVAGWSLSPNFPTTDGAYQTTPEAGPNIKTAFISKFSPDGSQLLYSTFLGGLNSSVITDIEVNPEFEVYVCGTTSLDAAGTNTFPVTTEAYDSEYNEGASDVFITKLGSNGDTLLASTYLGGLMQEEAAAICLSQRNGVYVTGFTGSTDFPTEGDGINNDLARSENIFVARFDQNLESLLYSTFIGGSQNDRAAAIEVKRNGDIYIVGSTNSSDFPFTDNAVDKFCNNCPTRQEAFLAKLGNDGAHLDFASFLGGPGVESAVGLAITANDEFIVAGNTTDGEDFLPESSLGIRFDALQEKGFIAKIDPDAGEYRFATYLGGSNFDHIADIALAADGRILATGHTRSKDFPFNIGGYQNTNGGGEDAFIAVLNKNGDSIIHSTYYGGGGDDRAKALSLTSHDGLAYITGITQSPDLPEADDRYGISAGTTRDGFILKYNYLLDLTAPDGGEQLCSETVITWNATSLTTTITLRLIGDGLPPVDIATNIPTSTGSYTWSIPREIGGSDYFIVVVDSMTDDILDSSQFPFEIFPQPEFSIEPQDDTICNNADARFSADIFGNIHPEATWSWQRSNDGITWTDIAGEQQKDLTIENLQYNADNGAQFRAVYFDPCFSISITTKAATLTIAKPILVTLESEGPTEVCPGQNITLKTENDLPEDITPTIIWQERRHAIWRDIDSLDDKTSFRLVDVQPEQNQFAYRVKVLYQGCVDSSAQIVIRVNPHIEITEHPADQTACPGDSPTFEAKVAPNEISGSNFGANAFWQKKNNILGSWETINRLGPKLTLQNVTNLDDGSEFRAVFWNSCGDTITSNSARLSMISSPNISLGSDTLKFDLGDCRSSAELTLVITNNGDEPVSLKNVDILPSEKFQFIDELPIEIDPHSSTPVIFRYSQGDPSGDRAQAEISFGQCGITETIELFGSSATSVLLSANTVSIDFGITVADCNTSGAASLIVVNESATDIIIEDIEVPTPFEVDQTGARILQPNNSLTIPVYYAPNIPDLHTGQLALAYSAADCRDTLLVLLRGRNANPNIDISPNTLDFISVLPCEEILEKEILIINTGEIDLELDSAVSISGPFITDLNSPLTLGPLEHTTVKIRYVPDPNAPNQSPGQLTFSAFALDSCKTDVPLSVNVKVEEAEFTPILSSIRYGEADPDEVIDRVAVFENTGNAVITVCDIENLEAPFWIREVIPELPAELTPGEALVVNVGFISEPGDFENSMRVIVCDPCSLSAPVTLSATGRDIQSVCVNLPNVQAKIGDVIDVPFQQSCVLNTERQNIATYRAEIAFNATLLTPVNEQQKGKIINGRHVVEIIGDYHRDPTLFSIPLATGLGNAENTVLEITAFEVYDVSGNPINIDVTTTPGTFSLTDVWRDNPVQLINPNVGPLVLLVSPSPASDIVTITYGGVVERRQPTLSIFGANGALVMDLTGDLSLSLQKESNSVTLNGGSSLSSGIYFCRLTSGIHTIVRKFVVE